MPRVNIHKVNQSWTGVETYDIELAPRTSHSHLLLTVVKTVFLAIVLAAVLFGACDTDPAPRPAATLYDH